MGNVFLSLILAPSFWSASLHCLQETTLNGNTGFFYCLILKGRNRQELPWELHLHKNHKPLTYATDENKSIMNYLQQISLTFI